MNLLVWILRCHLSEMAVGEAPVSHPLSDSDSEPCHPRVSITEACEAFERGLHWLEVQDSIPAEHLMLIRKWKDMAARKRERVE